MTNLKVKAAFDTFYTIGFVSFVIFMTTYIGKWLGIDELWSLVFLMAFGCVYTVYSSRLRQLQLEEKYPTEIEKE